MNQKEFLLCKHLRNSFFLTICLDFLSRGSGSPAPNMKFGPSGGLPYEMHRLGGRNEVMRDSVKFIDIHLNIVLNKHELQKYAAKIYMCAYLQNK